MRLLGGHISNEDIFYGVLYALIGAVCGFLLSEWRERKSRRELGKQYQVVLGIQKETAGIARELAASRSDLSSNKDELQRMNEKLDSLLEKTEESSKRVTAALGVKYHLGTQKEIQIQEGIQASDTVTVEKVAARDKKRMTLMSEWFRKERKWDGRRIGKVSFWATTYLAFYLYLLQVDYKILYDNWVKSLVALLAASVITAMIFRTKAFALFIDFLSGSSDESDESRKV
jgi:hypothetical protein